MIDELNYPYNKVLIHIDRGIKSLNVRISATVHYTLPQYSTMSRSENICFLLWHVGVDYLEVKFPVR